MTASERREAALAEALLGVLGTGGSIPPPSAGGGLGPQRAYAVAARVHGARLARGEHAAGRKIGFTNRALWSEFGAEGPMWGHVYRGTLRDAAELGAGLALAGLSEPRLEPEIVLGLARVPEPGMDEAALAGCLAWVAQGFEVVQSVYPGWAFGADDAVAAFGLHGALVVGERLDVAAPGGLPERLAALPVELWRDGARVAAGRGEAVLGGPLTALRFLVEDIPRRPGAPPLRAGDVVTTGTLTGAHPVAPGERWSTTDSGDGPPGLSLAFR